MNIHVEDTNTRLRTYSVPFADRAINHVMETIEGRVRIMCRAMQAFIDFDTGPSGGDWSERYDNLSMFSEVFYEYIDSQMDELNRLHRAIGAECTWLSLKRLHARRHYLQRLDQGRFRTREAFEEYCRFYGFPTGRDEFPEAADDVSGDRAANGEGASA